MDVNGLDRGASGQSSLDVSELEEQISVQLAAKVGTRYDLTCPASVDAEAGGVFTPDTQSLRGSPRLSRST
jgi:hypothetical protein